MAREDHSAQEIQAEVSRRIQKCPAVRDSGALVQVPIPDLRSADGTGLNWWMSGFGNALGFEEEIRVVLTEVAQQWNLKT